MSHNVPYKSAVVTWTPGSPFEFADFVPPFGPNGGRTVVDRFILCINGTITVGTGTWDGRDVARLANLVVVEKRDGRLRWSLNGVKSRIASIMFNGIEGHQEHGTVAIGAAQAIDYRLILPMAKPFLPRPRDYSLAADTFKKVTVTCNSLAGAATGTAVLSANALSMYILADWHEETKVEFKLDDIVKSVDFTSNTQAKLSTSGVVHDLYIVRDDGTAGGGNSITAITDARCEDLGTPTLTRADFVHDYTAKRKIAPSGPSTPATERFLDPVRGGFVLPFITADGDTSPWDGKALENLKLDVGTGAANLSCITREVWSKSESDLATLTAKHKVGPGEWQMETTKGNKQSLNDPHWNDKQVALGVWSAPLKKAA